ncbi:hypothetical protein V6N13_055030 [Hibiscus sabdariffa]
MVRMKNENVAMGNDKVVAASKDNGGKDNHRKQMSLNEHNGNKLNEMGEKMKGSHFAALASKNIDEQGSNDHGTGLGQLIQNNSMEFLFTTGLIDLGFQGPPFTGVCGNLHQRLDRCLVNECWFDYYNEAFVQHLDQLGSDHRPLLFCLMDVEKVQINRSFHFILAWQEHSQFSEFIQTTWACDVNLVANLDSFCTKIEEWNVDTFGHIG